MQLRQRGGEFLNPASATGSTNTMAAGTYQLERIFKGIDELYDRFKVCERLLKELELQAEGLEHKMTSDGDDGDH